MRLRNLILKWFTRLCPDYLKESIIGDLLEQYELNLARRSKAMANWLFINNVIRFVRIDIVRRNKRTKRNLGAMFTNYLIVALRALRKQKLYHTINFAGLTIGLSCCALVLLYVDHELSYDEFHHDPENTYRISSELNGRTWFPSIMHQYAEHLMMGEYPEIRTMTKFRRAPENFAIYDNNRIATNAIVTNPNSSFFDIFNFEVMEGDESKMLTEPMSVVLTQTMAEAVFGEGPYTGKLFEWDTLTLKVSGVIENMPSNTHLAFNLLIAADVPLVGVFAYVNLNENASVKDLEKKIPEIDIGNDHFSVTKVNLQPLEDIHFSNALTFELKPPGNKTYLYLLSGIALFILVISTTNYMNLSVAIYSKRTREMAIRKVLGSTKMGIAFQFLLESILLCILTVPVILLIIHFILPVFSQFVEIPLQNQFLLSGKLFAYLLGIVIGTGLVASLFPMISMSHFSILKLFRGLGLANTNGLNVRKVILTIQFVILLFLGTGAFFMNKQLHFIKTKDLGIATADIVKVSNVHVLYGLDKYHTIKDISLSNTLIKGFTTGTPPGTEDFGRPYQAEGHEIRSDAHYFATDLDYFDVMEIDGLYGDFFARKREDQPNISLLVNEKFVELMGWKDPIGKKVTLSPENNPRDYYIAGVFRDYHALSLHSEIAPQFIFARKHMRSASENILVKIDNQNVKESFEAIETAWYSVMPNSPISYEFMNKDIQKAYEQEQKAGSLSLLLFILAICLALMGLVGLSSYLSELRTKEIGIRKVLGASHQQILFLLNKEFISLILIATLVSSGIGYYAVTWWLESFAYRTTIDLLIFPLAGLLVLIITLLTVSVQSSRVVNQNPAEVIGYE